MKSKNGPFHSSNEPTESHYSSLSSGFLLNSGELVFMESDILRKRRANDTLIHWFARFTSVNYW